uniref:F-box domain-containing protein n=1 Tax=Bionectria ochroleuca TaxID=29856 RepID=A0A8H7TI73_BIOOC
MEAPNHVTGLQSLPVEILRCVIRLMDPIGVLSLAQASSYFRRIIDPGNIELGERLLQLETIPDHGGRLSLPGAGFRPQTATRAATSVRDIDLAGMRWACMGCMRLLSHVHFDNHSLLRLRFRKPIPGTPGHNPITSWDLSRYPSRARPRGPKSNMGRGDQTVTDTPEPNPDAVDDDDEWEGDLHEAIGVLNLFQDFQKKRELMRWGTKRHLRRCNECRFQMGHIGRRRNPLTGSMTIPIQMSRRVLFADAIERYFPGYLDSLGKERPLPAPPVLRWLNPSRTDYSWTMCMLRCPGCGLWQEWRDFIFANGVLNLPGIDYPLNLPEIHAQLSSEFTLCNHCMAERQGRDALGQRLITGLRFHLSQKVIYMVQKIERGFFLMRMSLGNGQTYRTLSGEDKAEMKNCMEGVFRGPSTPLRSDAERMGILRERFAQLTEFFHQLLAKYDLEAQLRDFSMWHELQLWIEHYHNYERMLGWAKDILDGDALTSDSIVDWALDRDGASLS